MFLLIENQKVSPTGGDLEGADFFKNRYRACFYAQQKGFAYTYFYTFILQHGFYGIVGFKGLKKVAGHCRAADVVGYLAVLHCNIKRIA